MQDKLSTTMLLPRPQPHCLKKIYCKVGSWRAGSILNTCALQARDELATKQNRQQWQSFPQQVNVLSRLHVTTGLSLGTPELVSTRLYLRTWT